VDVLRKAAIIFLSFITIFAGVSFSATIKTTDGNSIKVTVVSVKDGKVSIKGFGTAISLPLDSINMISFDDQTFDINGVVIDKMNFSGYVSEYSLETNEATVTTTSGRFYLKDLNVLKFWNVRQNTLKDEITNDYSGKKFKAFLGENTLLTGDIITINNGKILMKVDDMGDAEFDIKYVVSLIRDQKTEEVLPNSVMLAKGYTINFQSIDLFNDEINLKLAFGFFKTDIKNVTLITGTGSEPPKLPYYFVMNNNVRFYGNLEGVKDGKIVVKSNFGTNEISQEKIFSFVKIPPENRFILSTDTQMMYGEYLKKDGALNLKSKVKNKDIKTVKLYVSEESEMLKNSINQIAEIPVNTETKVFQISDLLYLFESETIKRYDKETFLEKNSLKTKMLYPNYIINTSDSQYILNTLGSIYSSKFDLEKTLDNSQITTSFLSGSDLYLGTNLGDIYKIDVNAKEFAVLKIASFQEEIAMIAESSNGIYVLTKNSGKLYTLKDKQNLFNFDFRINKAILDGEILYVIDFNKNLNVLNIGQKINKPFKYLKNINDLSSSKEYVFIALEDKISVFNKKTQLTEKEYYTNYIPLKIEVNTNKLYILSDKSLKIFEAFESY
jgi:hypothetical protein